MAKDWAGYEYGQVDYPKNEAILSWRRTLGSRLDWVERSLDTVSKAPTCEHQAEEDTQLFLSSCHQLHSIAHFEKRLPGQPLDDAINLKEILVNYRCSIGTLHFILISRRIMSAAH